MGRWINSTIAIKLQRLSQFSNGVHAYPRCDDHPYWIMTQVPALIHWVPQDRLIDLCPFERLPWDNPRRAFEQTKIQNSCLRTRNYSETTKQLQMHLTLEGGHHLRYLESPVPLFSVASLHIVLVEVRVLALLYTDSDSCQTGASVLTFRRDPADATGHRQVSKLW